MKLGVISLSVVCLANLVLVLFSCKLFINILQAFSASSKTRTNSLLNPSKIVFILCLNYVSLCVINE